MSNSAGRPRPELPADPSHGSFHPHEAAQLTATDGQRVFGGRGRAARHGAGGREYRQRFKSDVVVDLVSYRKHGHNEIDEPMLPQSPEAKTVGDLLQRVLDQHCWSCL